MAQLASARMDCFKGTIGLVVPKIVKQVVALLEPHLGLGIGGNRKAHIANALNMLRRRQLLRGYRISAIGHRHLHLPEGGSGLQQNQQTGQIV